jgi:THO complex subunit 4
LVNSGKSNEIKITNLHPDLTNEDLTKLMNTIGPTKNVEIKYNTHGQSTGVAIVQYESSEDAMNAIKKFDRRLAAGQIINVSTTMPLIDRIGGPNASSGRRQNKKLAGGKPNKRENKTLEDLDNELNMYMNGEPKSSIQQEQEQAQGQEGGQDQQQEQQQISVHDANETIPNSTQDAGEVFPVANDIAME